MAPSPTRMHGADAIFLYMETPSVYMHTIKIMIIDTSCPDRPWDWNRFRADIVESLSRLQILQRRPIKVPLGLHHPVWAADPDFDLRSHVFRLACPGEGTLQDFSQLVSEQYSSHMNPNKPLWKLLVVEGLQDNRVGIVYMPHHAYADGVATVSMMQRYIGGEGSATPDSGIPGDDTPLPSSWRLFADALRELPITLLQELPRAWAAAAKRKQIEKSWLAQGNPPPPSADASASLPFKARLSAGRRYACNSYALQDFKRIKRHFGVTINDVYLACISAAVREYTQQSGLGSGGPMVANVAFSLASNEERGERGNYSSTDTTWLHTEVADPVERLHCCARSAQAMKQHFEISKQSDLTAISSILPRWLVRVLARVNHWVGGGILPGVNVMASNVPGPREKYSIVDWEVEQLYSCGPVITGAALNMTVWSYADQMNLSILTDREAVDDAFALITYFTAALSELKTLADESAGQADERPAGSPATGMPATGMPPAPLHDSPGRTHSRPGSSHENVYPRN